MPMHEKATAQTATSSESTTPTKLSPSKFLPKVLKPEEYEEPVQPIKEKLNNLINKGRYDTDDNLSRDQSKQEVASDNFFA